ncbi:glutathione transferase [Aspergillus vadensis CBS 113365]|uniref:glutathione transferase n=1 Tax=Aspergillus vadensis (strain CBS 113365 / IMI 142717 / IBT 24658) TaxID=1448311 RepID=A0A319CI40_ASPVC|nr:glutathione transferase [Aspergillus vadensis CBS 113365]PYH67902.1 glutathione transferase [Aspergillus vadensis CBS 113365]
MTKPITVWLTPPGPNPWKVIVILVELQVPYVIESFKFDDLKKPPFININPNGRVPGPLPHAFFSSSHSGAIIQYLEEVYDKDKKLTYDSVNEKHLLNQYLHFQMSGQGPYFGQCGWFNVLHHEKLPSAIDRYVKEVHRVLSVLDTIPEGNEWLVGDKCTFADLAFLPWNTRLPMALLTPSGEDPLAPYPNVQAWQKRMESRPSWLKAMEIRSNLMEEQGLQPNGKPKGIKSFHEYQEYIANVIEQQQC